MTDTTVALITSVVTLITVLVGIISGRKAKSQVTGQVSQVHELVNNTADKQVKRIEQLTKTLQDSNTNIPESPK